MGRGEFSLAAKSRLLPKPSTHQPSGCVIFKHRIVNNQNEMRVQYSMNVNKHAALALWVLSLRSLTSLLTCHCHRLKYWNYNLGQILTLKIGELNHKHDHGEIAQR